MPRKTKQPRDAEQPIGRGVWSGSISFGLVTIPVELYAATRNAGVSTRMLGADGTPLVRQYVDDDGRALDDGEIQRGFEIAEGSFVTVDDDELEALAPRRSRDIELTRFVDRASIDPVYFVRPYFVVPGAGQTKAYRLLAETMEASSRAAIANFVMRGKAHAVAIFADGGVLRAETLRFADEVRSPARIAVPASRKADAALVAKMKRAIEKLATKDIDERELQDDEAARVEALVRRKLARGKDVVRLPETAVEETPEAEHSGGEVIDLFALIQKRLRAAPGASARTKARAPRKRSRR